MGLLDSVTDALKRDGHAVVGGIKPSTIDGARLIIKAAAKRNNQDVSTFVVGDKIVVDVIKEKI